MKPIELKIKGLNSFMDTQTIDFRKLTSRGIFGIFGPTGSGKSTVLDGITLALYGEIARKSSNFINVNCTSLMVSYEFQISDKKVKIYRVEREFRRESKTGKVRSKSARILDVTCGMENILEEGAKKVTEKCEEILGLKLEDFTRTVVLPQGKFSEFLKLEGKDRRDMLERLFGLQKYGDDLSFKLGSKIRREREKENLLQGQLAGYEGVDEKFFKEKKDSLEKAERQYELCKNEYDSITQKFNRAEELWKFQRELHEKIDEQKSFMKEGGRINEYEEKVAMAESALKVKPYVDSYEDTVRQVKILKEELSSLNGGMANITQHRDEVCAELNRLEKKRHDELPKLKLKQQKILDAIDESVLLKKLQQQEENLKSDIVCLKKELVKKNDEKAKNKRYAQKLSDDIDSKEKLINSLKMSEEYKKKIDDGIILLNDYKNLSNQKEDLIGNIDSGSVAIENELKKEKSMLKDVNEKQKIIDRIESKLNELIKNCPGDKNTLLNFQKKAADIKSKWDNYLDYKDTAEKNKKIIRDLTEKLREKSSMESTLKSEAYKLEEKLKSFERRNMVSVLRNTLSEGDLCPVCGSVYRGGSVLNEVDMEPVNELKKNLEEKQNKIKILSEEIIKIKTNIDSEKGILEENGKKLCKLGENFKLTPADVMQNKFAQLKDKIYEFDINKSELDKKLKILEEEENFLNIEYNKIVSARKQNEIQLDKFRRSLREEEKEFKIKEKELCALKTELSVKDFIGKKNEIIEREREKADLESEVEKLRDDFAKIQSQREILSSEIADVKEKLSRKQTEFQEKNKNIVERERSIKNKAGEETELEYLSKQISAYVKKVEMMYAEIKKDSEEMHIRYDRYKNRIIACQSNLVSFSERKSDEDRELEKVLKEQSFENTSQVKENLIGKSEIDRLNEKIGQYRNSLVKLKGTIENLRGKIGEGTLTEKQWIEIQDIKDKKNFQLRNSYESKIKLQEEVNSLNMKLSQLKDILKKKEKVEHKLALLDDLEKLFKGKKFVEFVAGNQLKYISLEADRKLREITCGAYGLEVDENSRFFIRDYKNGGKKRDASTLSGGETFVTSLSLALALSSQIQLKGRAPLELFFLDEGFGTLDENLLEIVIDSLEKIHNDRLSIGIISHLDSIKERMPAKLIVTPAESGMGGSKIRIELD